MATDQEIRDAGFKYIPQQKYLLNPFVLPTTDDGDGDGDGTPSVNVGGNSEGFSVYNPDPNRTRNQSNYNERPYKSLLYNNAFPMMGDPMANQATGALNADGLMSYAGDKPLEGIPGAISNYMKNSLAGKLIGNVVGGIENLLPVYRRPILENELLGQGFQLNDIGQFVSDGGNAYDPSGSNIMAGYNANKVTRETFDKRRAKAEKNMSADGFKEFNKALTAAEENFFGASGKATTVFNDKLKQKDIKKGFINDQGSTYDEEIFEEDEKIIDPKTLRYITKKKAAETADTTGNTGTDTTGTDTTGTDTPTGGQYTGTPGGNTGSGNFANIDNSGKNYGPYSNNSGSGGYSSKGGGASYSSGGGGASYSSSASTGAKDGFGYGLADGGRVYFFDGGRVAVMNGGLISLL